MHNLGPSGHFECLNLHRVVLKTVLAIRRDILTNV